MAQMITVFGSAQGAQGEAEYEEAHHLGSALARAGFGVCNGGYGGTMEACAKGARTSGGITLGVTIDTLRIPPNAWISKTIPMPSLIDRLQKLVDLGDGYVILPGGTGTLLELALVWELLTKHLMQPKPVVCLGQFWMPLVGIVQAQLTRERRIAAAGAVSVVESVDECIQRLTGLLR